MHPLMHRSGGMDLLHAIFSPLYNRSRATSMSLLLHSQAKVTYSSDFMSPSDIPFMSPSDSHPQLPDTGKLEVSVLVVGKYSMFRTLIQYKRFNLLPYWHWIKVHVIKSLDCVPSAALQSLQEFLQRVIQCWHSPTKAHLRV